MRQNNQITTQTEPLLTPRPDVDVKAQRMADGSYNSMDVPWMGMAGARFGRNVPITETFGETLPRLMEPNPRKISNELLARREFVGVPYLNVLVSSWLQFMVHDWLNHRGGAPDDPVIEIPIEVTDDWNSPPSKALMPRCLARYW